MAHWFGLPLPAGVTAVRKWGARAILQIDRQKKPVRRKGRIVGYDFTSKVVVIMVADRSNYEGPGSPLDAAGFFRWVEKKALPWLGKAADREALGLHENREIGFDEGPYHLRADPRASYGYLYIVAWEDAPSQS